VPIFTRLAAEGYEVELQGARFKGLLVRFRGGWVLSVEQDWTADALIR